MVACRDVKKHVFLRVKIYVMKYFSIFVLFLKDLKKNVFEQVLGTLFSQRGNAFVGPTDNCLKCYAYVSVCA